MLFYVVKNLIDNIVFKKLMIKLKTCSIMFFFFMKKINLNLLLSHA